MKIEILLSKKKKRFKIKNDKMRIKVGSRAGKISKIWVYKKYRLNIR